MMPKKPINRETTTIAGVRTHYTMTPGKPLMLLIRMIALESGVWDHVWRDLAESFSLANFNFHESEAAKHMGDPRDGFGRLANLCVDVAKGLGYDRFHLLGWVGGTQVALRCAIDHPQAIQSCILLNPHFELADMRPVKKGNEFKRAIIEKDEELYTYYWVMSGLSNAFVEANFDVVEQLVAARRAVDSFVNSGSANFMQWANALRTRCVSDEELASLDLPTLVVGGDIERWNAGPGPAMARMLHECIPASHFEMIENTGELVLIEAPARFIETVNRFHTKTLGA